jgi:hypothetical protein
MCLPFIDALQWRLHRFDVVRLTRAPESCTFIATATNLGDVVLQVSAKPTAASSSAVTSTTYVRIRVVSGIEPSYPLVHVGARICLHSVLQDVNVSQEIQGVSLDDFVVAFLHVKACGALQMSTWFSLMLTPATWPSFVTLEALR